MGNKKHFKFGNEIDLTWIDTFITFTSTTREKP